MSNDEIYTYRDMMGLLILGIVLGIITGVGCSIVTNDIQADVPELGQAICEEEYGMDYYFYRGEELTCQPKEVEVKDNYDGVIVKGVENV